MQTCPKCGAPLEQVYSPEGISEKCPQCDYHHDELADLLAQTDFEKDELTPIDRLSASQRRHYMLSMTMTLKLMTILEGLLVLCTLISLLFRNALISYIFLGVVLIIAVYLIHGYLNIRRRLGLDSEEQEMIIIDMLNQDYQMKLLSEKHKTKLGCSLAYLKYLRTLKKEGLPYRFKTDPLYHDRIMSRVRKETNMNRRIEIQNYKNTIASLYSQREETLKRLKASMFKDYGYHVAISFKLGIVIINGHEYRFDEINSAEMMNHVYDDEEEVVIKDGYFKAPEDFNVLPHSQDAMNKHDKVTYDEESGVYKHYAFVEPVTEMKKVKRCDAMNIIVETYNGKEIIPIIDQMMDVTTPAYIAKQNDCYNVTGGLRRVARAGMPKQIPDLLADKQVAKLSEEMEKTQDQLIQLLKTPVVYKVPEEYREKE